MRLLSRVYQVVFLQVGELSEALVARLAFERSFSTVHPEVDLQRSHTTLAWLPRQAGRVSVGLQGSGRSGCKPLKTSIKVKSQNKSNPIWASEHSGVSELKKSHRLSRDPTRILERKPQMFTNQETLGGGEVTGPPTWVSHGGNRHLRPAGGLRIQARCVPSRGQTARIGVGAGVTTPGLPSGLRAARKSWRRRCTHT